MIRALDLFAGGAGGWDVAANTLDVDPLGIELDPDACATREAAGLRTRQGDVAALDPHDLGPCELLIASAPCPTFSAAGKGAGRLLTEVIVGAMHELAAGNDTRPERYQEAYEIIAPVYAEAERQRAAKKKREADLERADARARQDAYMSLLVVEPLRWALALRPRHVALEQVPEVLGLWSEMAAILGVLGYKVWTGVMEAERYGVPQTRERAILMADREAPVHPPRPTHQRYVKGEPQRHEVTLEGEVLPWVSMAEALGWGGGRVLRTGQNSENGSGHEPYDRPTDAPALTVLANASRWRFRNGNQANAAVRDSGEPAPTIHFGKACNSVRWVKQARDSGPGAEREPRDSSDPSYTIRASGSGSHPTGVRWEVGEEIAPCGCAVDVVDADGFCSCCHAHLDDPDGLYAVQGDGRHTFRECPSFSAPTAYDRRSQNSDGSPVPTSRPAPTLTAGGLAKGTHQWVSQSREWGGDGPQPDEAPATTVAGDPRLPSRSHHDHGEQSAHAIRVSLQEAAILQSFPPDHPFQGTKSKRFLQVGNAVPPALAIPILGALLGIDWQPIHAEYLASYSAPREAQAA